MNKITLTKGRIDQKLKTRSSILAAAKRLMKKSKKITLEDIAEDAQISRATIYRYFSNVDLLVMEASLDIQHNSPQDLFKKVDGLSLKKRILLIQDYYNTLAQKNEVGFRRYLSTVLTESVTNKKKIRGARRVDSLIQSLEPYKKKLTKHKLEKLINISSVLMGIDALIVSKDVCRLDNKETSNLLKWSVNMILKGMEIDDM